MEGKFEFNAIVVDPPAFDEYDGGDAVDGYRDWTSWALDWTNRADLVAAWFHDNRDRRSKGLAYPFNFYQLSPMLVVLEEKHKPPVNIEEDYFQFMMPFTWELWGAILSMFVVVTVALGFIEGRLFIVPDHLRRQDGQAMKSASLGYNLKAWMTEFFLATMAFCQAGGWWGMSQAKTASGRFLSLFTEFGILIILSAYLGNITNLMLREQQSDLTTYSASSFEDLISRRANICYRERTALGDMMKNLGVVDLGQLVDVGENSGGFSNHTTYGADLMRSGDCDAMVLPEWFAENTLVMNGPNTPCDLRLKRDRIRTVTGGWVTASPYHRLNALTRTNPAATMSDVGCMDVCHHEPNTSLHANSPPPRPYPRFSAPCAQLVEETLGVLMLDYLSEEVESVRLRQKARIKEKEESRCDFNGYPSRSSAVPAASAHARRRLSREAEATHLQAASRQGRRQLKGKPATTTAAAVVTADGSIPAEETAHDLKLHLQHFHGFFILMALLLVFTLLTSPRLDWLVRRMTRRVGARMEKTKLAKQISLQKSSTMSSLKNLQEDQKALGAIADFGSALVKTVSTELEELNGELEKDHLDNAGHNAAAGGSASQEEVDAQKQALSDIMAILQSLQVSVQKIEAKQARRSHVSESTPRPSESTPRPSEGKPLILRPQSGHLAVRRRRSVQSESTKSDSSSPRKSSLERALDAGTVLDSASSPSASTWRLNTQSASPAPNTQSASSALNTQATSPVAAPYTQSTSPTPNTQSTSPASSTQLASPAAAPNTQSASPAPNTQAEDKPDSA